MSERFPLNTWPVPAPYGYPAAVEAVGSVAAPLLAGFSLTLLTVALSSSGVMRLADLALIGFSLAAVLLITTVQLTFWARQYSVTPLEAIQWHPDFETEEGRAAVRRDVWQDNYRFHKWAVRARRFYNLGIGTLLAAVSIALVPVGSISITRWIAIGIPMVGAFAEAAWSGLDFVARRADRSDQPSTTRWIDALARRLLYPSMSRAVPREVYASKQGTEAIDRQRPAGQGC